MTKAVCVFSPDAKGIPVVTWVPPVGTITFTKGDGIHFVGIGGSPSIRFDQSPFEPGPNPPPKTYTAANGASSFDLTIATDARFGGAAANFACSLIDAAGKPIQGTWGSGVPVQP